MADPYGSTQKAGSPTQVAGTGVGDVIVATDGLLSDHGHRAGRSAAHDTVGTVGLVRHAGMRPRTYNIGAGLFAFPLIHNLQVRVTSAASHQECALVFV